MLLGVADDADRVLIVMENRGLFLEEGLIVGAALLIPIIAVEFLALRRWARADDPERLLGDLAEVRCL